MAIIVSPEEAPAIFQDVWNSHDMKEFGSLFDNEATFVNRFGRYVKGVADILEMHIPIHETIYSDSTLENELIDVSQIADGAAIIHFWSRLTTGVAHPAGPHKVDTLILAVLVKQNEHWRIRALENVALTNPRYGEVVLRSGQH